MPDILLATLNARYAHAAFGLRYLLANMGNLRPRTSLLEFEINQRPLDIAETILSNDPLILGLGIYIWNLLPATELVAILKRIRPDLIVVLGGPEVSHESEALEIVRLADHVIRGEGEVAFPDLCRRIFAGDQQPRIIAPQVAELAQIQLPYDLYDEGNLAHRVTYVEASRGCPFECDFCLSALDTGVRTIPPERFLPVMQSLLDRGARHFKFVDRTFNVNISHATAILQFFLDRLRPGLLLHFEMVPDRLPERLRQLIRRFPPGTLQAEVGVQTFNEEVAEIIGRRQDNVKVEENLRFLRNETNVHVHADLIVGLPGEDLASFAAGFDRLLALNPQEIQVGILKRLRRAPIARHDDAWQMVYSPHPPYEVLRTKLIDFPTMQRLRRFARYFDLIVNSGHFLHTAPLVWTWHEAASPFAAFRAFSDWLYARTRQTHAIALHRLGELISEYLMSQAIDCATLANATAQDAASRGRARRQERHIAG